MSDLYVQNPEIVEAGRKLGVDIMTALTGDAEDMQEATAGISICIHASVHVLATAYHNDVVKQLRTRGPITEEEFFADLKATVLKEHDAIKGDMSLMCGTDPTEEGMH